MAEIVNTLDDLGSIEQKEYYIKAFMEELQGETTLSKYFEKTPLPKHNGKTVSWRLFKDVTYPRFKVGDKKPDGTTIASGDPLIGTLKELGEIPEDEPNKLELVEFSASIHKFGDRIQITEDVNLKAIDPVLNQSFKLMGREAGVLFEELYALGLTSGKNRFDSTATTSNYDAVFKELKKIKKFLQKKHVKPYRDGKYVAIADSDVEEIITSLDKFIDIGKYANPKGVLEGEIGTFGGFIWVINDYIPKRTVTTGSGDNAVTTTYSQVVFMGKEAVGTVELEGESNRPKLIYHAPGTLANDHYNEIHEIAWINRGFTTRVLRDEALIKYELPVDTTTGLAVEVTQDSDRTHYVRSASGHTSA